jgi:hypothetical protein
MNFDTSSIFSTEPSEILDGLWGRLRRAKAAVGRNLRSLDNESLFQTDSSHSRFLPDGQFLPGPDIGDGCSITAIRRTVFPIAAIWSKKSGSASGLLLSSESRLRRLAASGEVNSNGRREALCLLDSPSQEMPISLAADFYRNRRVVPDSQLSRRSIFFATY